MELGSPSPSSSAVKEDDTSKPSPLAGAALEGEVRNQTESLPAISADLFTNSVFERLGLLSYSLYLLHVPIFIPILRMLRSEGVIGVGWSGTSVVAVVVLGTLSLAASSLTYHWIERPFLVRKERFGERAAPRAAPAPAAS